MRPSILLFALLLLMPLLGVALLLGARGENRAAAQGVAEGVLVDVKTPAHADLSPPLRQMRGARPVAPSLAMLLDVPSGYEGPRGPQSRDTVVQGEVGTAPPPGLRLSVDTLPNLADVVPPDPVGDVGPDHYVAMSNLYFAVYDKDGELLYGPEPNNLLWQGFGGPCETENAGDPIVLYDQIDDRWMLSQFTILGPEYFNCVAVSATSDPTGPYHRYAFSNGQVVPDYPKYGLWHDALYISTRDYVSTFVTSIGAYAIDREGLIAGDPNVTMIHFAVPVAGNEATLGDGLLPADLDGAILPPTDSPQWFVGTMDDGGPYAAPQDALTLWRFAADFEEPAASTFALETVLPVAPFDSMFPCEPAPRDCIPQPETEQKLDVQSYRQRVLWRLAYRNFGSHESLVTTQSVEAAPGIAGVRWYELRDPGSAPAIYQQGTYAPGLNDGVHRWFASAAMDQEGNLALGYSASSPTHYPSIRYTGRLVSDPPGTLPRGEGEVVAGSGAQSGASRWGDYTSLNVDPTDDCTFWYTNQYLPETSEWGWTLRVGAFRFDECGDPDFALDAEPDELAACSGETVGSLIDIESIRGYADPVTLSLALPPLGVSASFDQNPVVPPGSATLSLSIGPSAAPGTTTIEVVGTAPTRTHSIPLALALFTAGPAAPSLLAPADGAVDLPRVGVDLHWQSAPQAQRYRVEVATEPQFTSLLLSEEVAGTTLSLPPLAAETPHFWRVRAENPCAEGAWSPVWQFTTESVPPILLVDDDDNNPDSLPYYESALTERGVSWDVWDTGNSDDEPDAATLALYPIVIWFTGDTFSVATGPGAAGEAALSTWLGSTPGACLFLSSQEYHFIRGLTPFMVDSLGAAAIQNDSGDYTAVIGQGPFAGASYALDYPFADFSDTVESGTGSAAFVGENGNIGALALGSASWRTTFWTFPLEAISPAADRADALGRVLAWCGGEVTAVDLEGPTAQPLDGRAFLAPLGALALFALFTLALWLRRRRVWGRGGA